MTYWDLHEPAVGVIDLRLLNKQLEIIEESGARVTLCLGMRQPRWPETHLPDWAVGLTEQRREKFFTEYLTNIVTHYRDRSCIESYQLENEFWNRNFGENNTFSRERLVREFELVRRLDPNRPILMSLGNTLGYPFRKPKADAYGTTLYRIQHGRLGYSKSFYPAWYFAFRRKCIKVLTGTDLIIHELQSEPWGPKPNWEMRVIRPTSSTILVMKKQSAKQIANKRSRFDYDLADEIVAGIVLNGAETKSLRMGHAVMRGSFATVKDGELWLNNLQINPLITNHINLPEETRLRARKLLVTKKQLEELNAAKIQGKSIVPIKILTEGRFIKVVLGVGRGKKKYDKRESIKKRDVERAAKRGLIE